MNDVKSTTRATAAHSAYRFLVIGCLFCGLGVIVGAFGAHALPGWMAAQGIEDMDSVKRIANLETGVRYHMYHALALCALGIWRQHHVSRLSTWAGCLFTFGIVAFSGGLYAYALTGWTRFAMIVPFGGVGWIVAWVLWAIAAASHPGCNASR